MPSQPQENDSSVRSSRARRTWKPSNDVESALANAVRHSPFAMALIDLASGDWVAMSQKSAEILGYQVDDVINSYDLWCDGPAISELLALLSDRKIDGYQAHRQLRRSDGGQVQLELWLRVVDVEGADNLALVVCSRSGARASSAGDAVDAVVDEAMALPSSEPAGLAVVDGSSTPVAVATLDDDWRIDYVSGEIKTILGYPVETILQTPLLGTVNPHDAGDLLAAVAQAQTNDAGIGLRLRLRTSAGAWRWCRLMIVNLHGKLGNHLGLVLSVAGGSTPQLAEHAVHQTAQEVSAARVLNNVAHVPDRAGLAELSGLTVRQLEIVTRLSQGQRVPAIARALYTSPSTVRNHLSAIYRKLRVRSQQELLDILYGRRNGDPNS